MLKLKQILCSILVLGSLLSSPSLWAQKETKVNIAARQISLKNLIQAVEKQTDYTFVFDNSIPLSRIVSLKGGSQYLSDVLKQAFDKSDIAYEIVGKQIVFCVVMFGLINVNILYYSFSTLYQMCNLRQSL